MSVSRYRMSVIFLTNRSLFLLSDPKTSTLIIRILYLLFYMTKNYLTILYMYLENSIHCFSRSGTLLEQKKKKQSQMKLRLLFKFAN